MVRFRLASLVRQCISMLLCGDSCSHSAGLIRAHEPDALLTDLLAAATYRVWVFPVADEDHAESDTFTTDFAGKAK